MSRLLQYVARFAHNLGRPLRVGSRDWRVKGYSGNPLPDPKHEPHFFEFLQRVLHDRPGAFIDVGANVGQTMLKVLSADPLRRYIGFEPQVFCCYGIEEILRLNSITGACVVPIALTDRNGLLTFYTRGAGDEMAGLIEPVDAQEPILSKVVAARIGDEVMRELGDPDIAVIKIDVEGAELAVMRGLRETMRSKKPVIVFEVLPNFHGVREQIMYPPEHCEASRVAAAGIFALLTELGYRIWQLADDGAELPITAFELDDCDNFLSGNYVAYPT